MKSSGELRAGWAAWRARQRPAAVRLVHREFTCPATGLAVEVQALRARASGDFTGILTCSAQAPGEEPPCSPACVRELNLLALSER